MRWSSVSDVSDCSVRSSSIWTFLIVQAEMRKDAASTTMATGAVTAWMSAPPNAGPAIKEAERVPTEK